MDRQATIIELPIFPLGRTVLFPGATLALHIFEDRYKAMIGRCLAGDRHFGVALLREGVEVGGEAVPYEIGTVAQIVRAIKMKDGRYNLVTRGASRFQILSSSYGDAGYLTGQVELLTEEEHDLRRLTEQQAAIENNFTRFIGELAELTGAKLETIDYPDDPTGLSYFVGEHLPVYAWEKQRLLGASSTDVRLDEEARLLSRERGMLREFGVIPVTARLERGQEAPFLPN
jgi:Lon protease-like protein